MYDICILKTFKGGFYMNKKFNYYGVSLSGLWLHLWFMKLFAVFDRRSSTEAIQANINSAFKIVISKIDIICKNYIGTHRSLIVEAYLNRKQTSTVSEIPKTDKNDSASIVQQKKKAQEAAKAAQEKYNKIAQSKNNCAELLTYENELIDYVDSITQKANSYIYEYIKKIQKKKPQLIVNVENPFDNYCFSITDYNLRIKEDINDIQTKEDNC